MRGIMLLHLPPLSATSEFISTRVLLWPPIFLGQCQIALLQVRCVRMRVMTSLFTALVLTRLDCGNATLAGLPTCQLNRLQSVLRTKAALRIVNSAAGPDDSSPHSRWSRFSSRGCTSVEQSAYHTDFTVITANVQAAAQDIPVRAVVFVTSLLHCLRHDFLCFNFLELRIKCHVNLLIIPVWMNK